MALRAIVLGGGMVGVTMARDLAGAAEFEVAVADINAEQLGAIAEETGLPIIWADVSDPDTLRRTIAPFDIVVGALPSRMGFATLRSVIEAGKNYCDISFMPENALELDELAQDVGVTAVVDAGVAPGLSNLIVGHVYGLLDRAEFAAIYVGGLPRIRRWPFQYKAPFAPSDVIEEYTRPARIVVDGKIVEREALSEPELLDFDRIGTLEAFNTDGLRSLIHTLDIPNMIEKTLRYPGHRELMHAFRETGLFGEEEVEVGGVRVRPLDVTARLMFPKWKLDPGEQEFTVMRVIVEGVRGGSRERHVYELYDEFDTRSGATSMSRTTAFPCTSIARLVASGKIAARGVLPPELLARERGVFEHVLAEVRARGVRIEHRIE
jgi:lysine 6-dehydrogenase